MYIVEVLPDTDLPHSAKIYAGLSDLAENGAIDLKVLRRVPRMARGSKIEFEKQCIWLNVHDETSRQTRKICIDVEDGGWVNCITRIRMCDVYYKRSYYQPVIDALPYAVRHKVRPFGLNYACRSRYDKTARTRLFWHKMVQRDTTLRLLRGWKDYFRNVQALKNNEGAAGYPYLYTDVFEHRVHELGETIVYFFRVWNRKQCPSYDSKELEALNNLRADVYRALREEFGEQLVGGAVDNELSRKMYSDCIATEPTEKRHFLRSVSKSRICVTTTGLHGSTGFRLAEYLAAGICIVTEPIGAILPEPLTEGVNVLSYQTPYECVSACKRLLEDDDFARLMSENNFTYYKANVSPENHMWKLIQGAFDQ